MNDYSMICQFALSAREDLTKELINVSKNFFAKREAALRRYTRGRMTRFGLTGGTSSGGL